MIAYVLNRLFATPWTVALQASLPLGFSRQEYWNGLPFHPSGDLPNPGIKSMSSELASRFFTTEPPGKPKITLTSDIPDIRRRQWHPTPVFFPGKSHGQRSLEGYSPWGCKDSDSTGLTLSLKLSQFSVQGDTALGNIFSVFLTYCK